MKILLVSSTFPPRKFGGMTAASFSLAKSLVERGHNVTVYTTDVKDRHSRIHSTEGVQSIDRIQAHYFRNLSNYLASKHLYLPIGVVTTTKTELNNFDIIQQPVGVFFVGRNVMGNRCWGNETEIG